MAPPQSASLAQARQVCVAVLQVGVPPPQSALRTQATQVAVVALQTVVVPPQAVRFVAEHCPHAPFDSQAGVAPPQSPSPAHPRQVWVAVLHTGVVPEQLAFEMQATQAPTLLSQAGVAPVHFAALVAEHWPQAPFG